MSAKAIYRPSGKAGEYAAWACNLYTGCSNDCDFCYCKKGPLGSIWAPEPGLKKCFRNEEHAYTVFINELEENISDLRRDGLFFSFTTDPFLKQTRRFTWNCILTAVSGDVPVSVLTKRADFIDDIHVGNWINRCNLAFGFTLTGCDDLEKGASTNGERLLAMRRLHNMGFKTFASLEPVVDPAKTMDILSELIRHGCCDLMRCGLQSGRKEPYDIGMLKSLYALLTDSPIPTYVKHSFTDLLGEPRQEPKDIFRI